MHRLMSGSDRNMKKKPNPGRFSVKIKKCGIFRKKHKRILLFRTVRQCGLRGIGAVHRQVMHKTGLAVKPNQRPLAGYFSKSLSH